MEESFVTFLTFLPSRHSCFPHIPTFPTFLLSSHSCLPDIPALQCRVLRGVYRGERFSTYGPGRGFRAEQGFGEVCEEGFVGRDERNVAAFFDGMDEAGANHAVEEAANAGGFFIEGGSDFGGGERTISSVEGVKNFDALRSEGVAEEGALGKGPAGVIRIEGESEGAGFEIVA